MEHSALLLRIPSQIPNSYLGFILFIGDLRRLVLPAPCQHAEQILASAFPMQSFECCLPITTLVTSGEDAPCMLHQPRQCGRVITERLLRGALNVAFDGSNHLRICITAFSIRPFGSLTPFTASSVVTSALYISSTRSIAKVDLFVSSSLLCLVTWWCVRPLPIMKCVHQSLNCTCVASCSSIFFCVGLFLGPALTRQSGVAHSSSLSTPSASTDISSLPLQLRSMMPSSASANFLPSALSRSHNAAGLTGSSKAAWPLTVPASWKLDPFRLCKPACPSCTLRCSRPAWSSFRLRYFGCADSFHPARQRFQFGLLFALNWEVWQHSYSWASWPSHLSWFFSFAQVSDLFSLRCYKFLRRCFALKFDTWEHCFRYYVACGSGLHGDSDFHPSVLQFNDLFCFRVVTAFHAQQWRLTCFLHLLFSTFVFVLAFFQQTPCLQVFFVVNLLLQRFHCPLHRWHTNHSCLVSAPFFVFTVFRNEGDAASLSQEGITSAGTFTAWKNPKRSGCQTNSTAHLTQNAEPESSHWDCSASNLSKGGTRFLSTLPPSRASPESILGSHLPFHLFQRGVFIGPRRRPSSARTLCEFRLCCGTLLCGSRKPSFSSRLNGYWSGGTGCTLLWAKKAQLHRVIPHDPGRPSFTLPYFAIKGGHASPKEFATVVVASASAAVSGGRASSTDLRLLSYRQLQQLSPAVAWRPQQSPPVLSDSAARRNPKNHAFTSTRTLLLLHLALNEKIRRHEPLTKTTHNMAALWGCDARRARRRRREGGSVAWGAPLFSHSTHERGSDHYYRAAVSASYTRCEMHAVRGNAVRAARNHAQFATEGSRPQFHDASLRATQASKHSGVHQEGWRRRPAPRVWGACHERTASNFLCNASILLTLHTSFRAMPWRKNCWTSWAHSGKAEEGVLQRHTAARETWMQRTRNCRNPGGGEGQQRGARQQLDRACTRMEARHDDDMISRAAPALCMARLGGFYIVSMEASTRSVCSSSFNQTTRTRQVLASRCCQIEYPQSCRMIFEERQVDRLVVRLRCTQREHVSSSSWRRMQHFKCNQCATMSNADFSSERVPVCFVDCWLANCFPCLFKTNIGWLRQTHTCESKHMSAAVNHIRKNQFYLAMFKICAKRNRVRNVRVRSESVRSGSSSSLMVISCLHFQVLLFDAWISQGPLRSDFFAFDPLRHHKSLFLQCGCFQQTRFDTERLVAECRMQLTLNHAHELCVQLRFTRVLSSCAIDHSFHTHFLCQWLLAPWVFVKTCDVHNTHFCTISTEALPPCRINGSCQSTLPEYKIRK